VQRVVANRDAAGLFSTNLTNVLQTITPIRRAILIGVLVNHLPVSQIAAKLGITPGEVRDQYSRTISILRHPTRAAILREDDIEELLRHIVSGSAFGVTTEQVKCDTHGWQELVSTAARCELCPCELPRPELGRLRRYCSNACRQKAYRQRKEVC
jgi:hypothetical protein